MKGLSDNPYTAKLEIRRCKVNRSGTKDYRPFFRTLGLSQIANKLSQLRYDVELRVEDSKLPYKPFQASRTFNLRKKTFVTRSPQKKAQRIVNFRQMQSVRNDIRNEKTWCDELIPPENEEDLEQYSLQYRAFHRQTCLFDETDKLLLLTMRNYIVKVSIHHITNNIHPVNNISDTSAGTELIQENFLEAD